MKKVLSLVLSLFIAMTVFTVSFAADETLTVSGTSAAYTFTVTAKTTRSGVATIKVFPYTPGEPDTITYIPVYIGQLESPTGTDNGKNVYTFTFDFLTTQTSGNYCAIVNNEETKAWKFKYINPANKVSFYKALKAADSTGIKGVINTYKDTAVDFDLGNYLSYADTSKIDAQIDALDTTLPALGAMPTSSEIETYISTFEGIFKPAFAKLLATAEIYGAASSTSFDALVKANSTVLGLDMTYYNNTTLGLLAESVYNRAKTIAPLTYADTDVQDAFDTAVLLAIIDTLEYGVVTNALNHYDGGCITLDKTYSGAYTSEAEHNALSLKLKQNATIITDAATLEAKYLEYSQSSGNGGTPSPGPTGDTRPVPTSPGGNGGGTPPEKEDPKPADPVPAEPLSDIAKAEWARESIEYLVEEGVLSGRDDGQFYPNDTVTREEFVKIIVEAFDISKDHDGADFNDVKNSRWSYEYIAAALKAGIVSGDSESTFNPTGRMSRQDMAVIIYRTAKALGYELADDDGADFADITDVSDYAKDAVKALCAKGIVNGTGDNKFSPKDTVTRAQAAKIVYEALKVMGGNK